MIEKLPFASVARLSSPYESDPKVIYHLLVDVKDLPSNLPTEVNPRAVNKKTKVFRRIEDGLQNDEEQFYVENRGILISAKGVKIDSLNKVIMLNVGSRTEADLSQYGILDGGHTYQAILTKRSKIAADQIQYVHLEVITGIDEIDSLASARNTSVAVGDKAIAELADKFDFVKSAISELPFAGDISYKENESEKPLDATDLIRLMYAFNISKYPEGKVAQPVPAYSGKAAVLKDYLTSYDESSEHESSNPYYKLAQLLPGITKLYDLVEKDMANKYRDITPNGKFGKIKGIELRKTTTKYYGHNTEYTISQGLLLPIVGAFRALVKDNGTRYDWTVDPDTVWNSIGAKLVNNTVEMSRSLGNNPQAAGKNSNLWSQNFDAVNTAQLQIQLDALSAE
ncbi:hypothetical protein FC50_GL001872 [Lacticaseibacillus pantheris DSM 15945 = JCM 12539 = NBRC 106106]|uniref:Abortive phage infection protein C-terminal domain-containing protein n=2 Tax=Lacticaseibacillus pantheris TaxID=171523 RepID=A0A0R1U1E1_9LACO|nr:hypothetical protein FC50_GL001872 [Lacticaseibacillus pantheris DSM 15945 = JCM 12539 = NBRC 106106]